MIKDEMEDNSVSDILNKRKMDVDRRGGKREIKTSQNSNIYHLFIQSSISHYISKINFSTMINQNLIYLRLIVSIR